MSRIPQFSSHRKVVKKTASRLVSPGSRATEKTITVVHPSESSQQGPTLLQKKVFREALGKSALQPKKKVWSTGAATTSIPQPSAITKRGVEAVLQQVTVEKTIQRTPKAEYIAKTIKNVEVDPNQRSAKQLEMTSQEIDPTYATESAGVNITVSSTSSVTVTKGGKQTAQSFSRRTTTEKRLINKPNMNPAHVNRMIREEAEDVDNTLKMIPPDLITASIEKFPLRKKLQSLRLNSESIALLEQNLIHPKPTADEVDAEAPPEVMASVMNAVEKGATPDNAPNQIFNTLFPELQAAEDRVPVSSVAPGPVLDMVVPTAQHSHKFTEEVLTEDMEVSLVEVQTTQELPLPDYCVENKITAPPREDQGEKKIPTLLESEVPPWESANVAKIYALVGGDPIDLLESTEPSVLEDPQTLEQELAKGIDYFVEADTNPYETKIQLRGSRCPPWFAGYMAAFPHYPELVRISKSPSGVLLSAWKSVQPKVFPEDSLLIA